MKKVLSLALVLILALTILAGCAPKAPAAAPAPAEPAATTPAAEPAANDGSIVKLGLGHLTSIAKSTDLGKDNAGKEVLPTGQVDTIIAAVGFDKDGKVVSITIDDAQTKVNFDNKLQLTSDPNAEYKTKNELKDGYGLIKASKIGKEWYQQADALGKWMVGKTIDEIKAMKTVKNGDSEIADVPELTSLVTISVSDYIAAEAEAFANAK